MIAKTYSYNKHFMVATNDNVCKHYFNNLSVSFSHYSCNRASLLRSVAAKAGKGVRSH